MYNPNFDEESDRRRMQNKFRRKFPKEFESYQHGCPEGFHWVRSYTKDNGERVKGHCSKDPEREDPKFQKSMNNYNLKSGMVREDPKTHKQIVRIDRNIYEVQHAVEYGKKVVILHPRTGGDDAYSTDIDTYSYVYGGRTYQKAVDKANEILESEQASAHR
jgi:hypothetical protein